MNLTSPCSLPRNLKANHLQFVQSYWRDCFLKCFLRWWESLPVLPEGCVCLRGLFTSQINSHCTDVPWRPTVLHVLWEVFEGSQVWCGRGESGLQNETGKPPLHNQVRVYSACEHGNAAVPLSGCGWFVKEVLFAIVIGVSNHLWLMVAQVLFPECCACKLIDNCSSLNKYKFPIPQMKKLGHKEVKSITSGEVSHLRKMEGKSWCL